VHVGSDGVGEEDDDDEDLLEDVRSEGGDEDIELEVEIGDSGEPMVIGFAEEPICSY